MHYVLGIDPGTGRTGWGIVKMLTPTGSGLDSDKHLEYIAHGCIVTSQNDSMPKRLHVLHKETKKIISTFKPEIIAIESIFFGRNSKTAISVGQARGVIMLAAAIYKLSIFEYTGISVKHLLSGHGRTEKKDMQKIVRRLLNKNSRKLSFNTKDKGFDDAADALAIAIYHIMKLPKAS